MIPRPAGDMAGRRAALRRLVVRSRFAAAAALPLRAAVVARHTSGVVRPAASWLVRERETMNYSYDISPLNRDHLAWFVAAVLGTGVEAPLAWMAELDDDAELRSHVREGLRSNPERGIGPRRALWSRRVGWYAMIRGLRPDHVVESGTALGLGSCVMAAALLRNGRGTLTTVDTDPSAGHLLSGRWASVVERRTGDSLAVLDSLRSVDVFVHDSLHTYEHETRELEAVGGNLTGSALVISDNAHQSAALSDWARATGRRFLFFKELPVDHWWSGDGIGVAWPG